MIRLRFPMRAIALLLAVLLSLALASSRLLAAPPVSPDEMAKIKRAENERIEAIDRVYGSVAAIYGKTRQGGGSGVVFDDGGYVLTNYHVVAGAGTEGWAGLADGKLYPWRLLGVDPGGDLAIIRLEGRERFVPAPFGDSNKVRVGDWAMAMGNPFLLAQDQRPTVTLGIVSGVERYQYGQSQTTLVYGNCIQVDSSINPGNSGGPLFTIDGRVIGINGRGSFLERGRVNVGVGYAISVEQCKNFLPDMLATKTALHGTLDAVFSNRREGVVCSQINLDARVAQLGLKLGDELIAFDGQEISNANQLTNLITTIPAGWPVSLMVRRGDEEKTIWLRLPDLPYDVPKKPQPPARRMKPGPRPPEPEEPTDEEPQIDLGTPGKIRLASVNRRECRRIWNRAAASIGPRQALEAAGGFEFDDDVIRNGVSIGRLKTVVSVDGRFRAEANVEQVKSEFGHDGAVYWRKSGDGAVETLGKKEALRDPLVARGAALATMLRADAIALAKKYELQGSDRAQGRRSYRVRLMPQTDLDLFFWFSLEDKQGRPQVRLLKSGQGRDGEESGSQLIWNDWREVGGVSLPMRCAVVESLAETTDFELIAADCQPTGPRADERFRSATDVDASSK